MLNTIISDSAIIEFIDNIFPLKSMKRFKMNKSKLSTIIKTGLSIYAVNAQKNPKGKYIKKSISNFFITMLKINDEKIKNKDIITSLTVIFSLNIKHTPIIQFFEFH